MRYLHCFQLVFLWTAATAWANSSAVELMKEGNAFAVEQSWERAIGKYEAALAQEPNEAETTLINNRILIAQVYAGPADAAHVMRNPWGEAMNNRLIVASKPFDARPFTNEVSLSLVEARLHIQQNYYVEGVVDLLRDAMDRLVNAPASPENWLKIERFLARQSELIESRGEQLPDLIPIMEQIMRIAPEPDLRGRAAFLLTRVTSRLDRIRPEHPQLWETVRTAARETAAEPLVEAAFFEWKITHSWEAQGTLGEPFDIPAQIDEVKRLLTNLNQAPKTFYSSTVSRNLNRHVRTWDRNRLEIGVSPLQLPDHPVEFAYGTAGFPRIEMRLYRIPANRIFGIYEQQKSRHFEKSGEFLSHWTIAEKGDSPKAWAGGVEQLTELLPPGIYLLHARGENDQDSMDEVRYVTVGRLQAHIALHNKADVAHQAMVRDAVTGEPLAHTRINGHFLRTVDGKTTWETETDQHGVFSFPAALSRQTRGKPTTIYAEANASPFFVHTHVPSNESQRLWVDVMVDRPLHRPGEDMHWKIWVRNRNKSTWTIPKDLWNIVIRNADHEVVQEKEDVALNEFGAIDDTFTIPLNSKPGEFTLHLQSTADRQRQFDVELSRVDNYVPPALHAELRLAGSPDALRPGGELVAEVSAQYLSGGPAVGTPVELTITDSLQRSRATPPGSHYTPLERVTLRGKTGADGTARLRWHIPRDTNPATAITLNYRVLPIGGQPTADSAMWQLSESGRAMEMADGESPRLVDPTDVAKFRVTLLDGSGTPHAFHGEGEWVRLAWQEAYLMPNGAVVDQHTLEDKKNPWESFPSDWKALHRGYVAETVSEFPISATGNGTFESTFQPPGPGLYQLRIKDRENRFVGGTENIGEAESWRRRQAPAFHLVVADETTGNLGFQRNENLLILPETTNQHEPLKALFIATSDNRPGVATIAHEDSSRMQATAGSGRLHWVDLADDTRQPGARYVTITTGPRETLAQGCMVQPPRPPLHIKLETPSTTQPGEITTVEISTTDAKGQPVDTEVSLSAADEAVLRLIGSVEPHEIEFTPWSGFANVRSVPTAGLNDPVNLSLVDRREGTIVKARGGLDDDSPLVTLDVVWQDNLYAGYTASGGGVRFGYRSDSLALMDSSLAHGYTAQGMTPAKAPNPSIHVRRHFASTAAWRPNLRTGADGKVSTQITWPDNLTAWHLATYAADSSGQAFAVADTSIRSSLPFQTRLQSPRFLIEGDTLQTSVRMINRTENPIAADAILEIAGPVTSTSPTSTETPRHVEVPSHDEHTEFWEITADEPGQVSLTATASSDEFADAMQVSFSIEEDGIPQKTAASGRLNSDQNRGRFDFELPAELDPQRTSASLRLSTSPAIAALDALPYLVHFPYGCVEQTMNRFVPALMVRDALQKLNLDPAKVDARLTGRIEDGNAPAHLGTGKINQLDAVVEKSIARLVEAQLEDGGFGWWPGAPNIDPWMTAYVGWSLGLARTTDVQIPEQLYQSTLQHCENLAYDRVRPAEMRAWLLLACSQDPHRRSDPDLIETATELFDLREKIETPAGRAALALALATFGNKEQRDIIIRNLENAVIREESDLGELLHWGQTGGYRIALDGANESTALTVLALTSLAPDHPMIEPAVQWLALNRRGIGWANTRDTAFAVFALIRHLSATLDSSAPSRVTVLINGRKQAPVSLSADSLLDQPKNLQLPVRHLRGGTNKIELRRRGADVPIYATALGTSWAEGDSIKPFGHLVDIDRQMERQRPVTTLLGATQITPESLPSTGEVDPGEQIRLKVRLDVPHAVHYAMIKIPRPAGCEPLNPLSGWDTQLTRIVENSSGESEQSRDVYREVHDDHSAFFIDHLEAGTWELNYSLRSVSPGNFRVLPATVEAMYVPEIRANSDSRRLKITQP